MNKTDYKYKARCTCGTTIETNCIDYYCPHCQAQLIADGKKVAGATTHFWKNTTRKSKFAKSRPYATSVGSTGQVHHA